MSYSKIFSFYFFFLLIFFVYEKSFSQSDEVEWFPEKSIFPFIEYDLLEVKPYAGIFSLSSENVEFSGVYIPVNIGFRKSFIGWNMFNMKLDFSSGLASYTQFEIIRFDENTLRGGLINTDFKISGILSATRNSHKFRLQIFHISSHLGDDYIIRNQKFETNDKSVNYEQIDLTYLYSFEYSDIYIGIGEVISKNAYRKRFMGELGYQLSIPINQKLDFAFGGDVKLYEENDFIPDVHSALGISLKQQSHIHLNFSLDMYCGKLPYSTLNFGSVYWFGLSSKLYL